MRFTLPGPVDLEAGVEVSAGAAPIDPVAVEARGDSLFIALPEVIAADSLEVRFTTRVLQNAALFALDLGTNQRPGLWQSVEAMTRRANIVLLPELTSSRWLIDDLVVNSTGLHPQWRRD